VSSLLQEESLPSGALRVAVVLVGGAQVSRQDGPCGDGPVEQDILVESCGVRVVADPESAPLMEGSVLDYSEDLQKGGLGTCFCVLLQERGCLRSVLVVDDTREESTVRLT